MQCVTPMFRRYWIGEHSKGKIVSRSEVMENLDWNPNYIRYCLDTMNKHTRDTGRGYLYEQIPCQHCWACNLNKSAEWATRIMFECLKSDHNYFVTLTYDELNLPLPATAEYNGLIYENDGTWTGSLLPSDVDRFLNSLRKHLERQYHHTGMKYYYCGEYGPTGTHRPHYHLILMNCPLNIKEFYDFHIKNGKYLWKSPTLDNLWKNGFCEIGEVEFASAAYVARYTMKKMTTETDKTIYWSQGKMPEFVRMSRRPGIGMDYYEEHKEDIYKYDSITVRNFHDKNIKVKPPSAWDKKFAKTHPDQYKELKKNRKEMAERSRQLLQEMSNQTDKQRLEIQAYNIITKGKMLPRENI